MSARGAVASARCVHAKAAAIGTPFIAQRQSFQRHQSQPGSSWPWLHRVPTAPSRKFMSNSANTAAPVAPPPAAQAASSGAAAPTVQHDFLVQYVVVRKDLWGSMGWPLGSVVAQACHASSAAIWTYRDEEATQKYLAPDNIDHMRKVVLEVKDEAQLRKLSEALTAGGIGHKLWVEQPEDFPTCLATRPYPKSEVASFFKKFQLSKAPVG